MKNFIILLLFTGLSLTSLSQNVVQGEYFIDTDSGYGNNTLVSLTPSADNSFPLNINLSGFRPGYHKLYIRTKDSDGNWSFTTRSNIEILTSAVKTIAVRGEYFIATDPGFGSATPITISTPDSIILQNFTALSSGLPEGYHKLYGRFIDNEGRWGLTFRRNLEVYKSFNTSIVKAEYFFRTDLGFGNCATVTIASPAPDGSFSFNIPRNTIPAGTDTLFIRVQDDIENKWSVTHWQNGISSALPLTLLSFNVTKSSTSARLNWQTTHEVNTAYFNVQRSPDGISFTTIGKVAASPGSSAQNNYSYLDDITKLTGGKAYYRLQMTDIDGRFTYSRIAYITIDPGGIHITLYPNPAHGYFVIGNYENMNVGNAHILVRDIAGRLVISQKFRGGTNQKINIASLAKGLYTVSMVTNGNVYTQKILVE